MSEFNRDRRAVAAAVGSLVLSPIWLDGIADQQQLRDGAAPQATTPALDLTGDRMNEAELARTRRAFEMLLNDLEAIRRAKVPPGIIRLPASEVSSVMG